MDSLQPAKMQTSWLEYRSERFCTLVSLPLVSRLGLTASTDEKVPIYAVLRTPYQDDETLQRYIPRLNIAIEAHAFSSPAIMSPTNEGGPAPTARDVIWASRLDVSEDPVFVVVGSDEDEDGHDVLLMWKMDGFLSMHGQSVSCRVLTSVQIALGYDFKHPLSPSKSPRPCSLSLR